jgi:FlaG/FlaF family flagellin (archaellin)
VISTILMVAITVVLASVLYVLVSGMLFPPPAPPASVVFGTQGWNEAAGRNTASILSASGTQTLPVSELTYSVKDTDGAVFFSGRSGDSKTTEVGAANVTVTVSYNDNDGGNRITPGDTVAIQIQPASAWTLIDGGLFEMYHSGRQVGSHAIG